jgi:hypothetical protein
MSVNNTYKENSQNTKISADLQTLKNSLTQYIAENQTLPNPQGNINFFDRESNYVHSGSGSYGVHGYMTENLLPRKYINYLPIDPRTNQYYAFGKTFI